MTDSSTLGGAEPRSHAASHASGAEIDQVRATLQVLHGAATLLQGAVEQRESLLSEIASAEQALAEVLQKHLRAEHALAAAQDKLERTIGEAEQAERLRADQSSLATDFDKTVNAVLARRGALVQEIVALERRRDLLSQTIGVAQPVSYAIAEPPPIEYAPLAAPIAPIYAPLAPVMAAPVGAAVLPSHPSPTMANQLAVRARFVAEHMPHRPQVQLHGLPGRIARIELRHVPTIALATILLGLAVLLTPVSQVFGGLQLLAVMSGSMEPTINVGGIVGIRPVPANELRAGDVITFANQSAPDVLVTHRIVSIENRDGQSFLTTKGDANDSVDAMAAPATRAVGRVDFSLPWLGFLMMWLSSPLAKVGILVVSIVGFALPGALKRSPETAAEAVTVPVVVAEPVSPAAPVAAVTVPTPIGASSNYVGVASSYTSLEQELEALLGSTQPA
jgi:signal peptidase